MVIYALTLHRVLIAFADAPIIPGFILIGIGLILHELKKRKDSQ